MQDTTNEMRTGMMQEALPIPRECMTQYGILEGATLGVFADKSAELGMQCINKFPRFGLSWIVVDDMVRHRILESINEKTEENVSKVILSLLTITHRRALVIRAYDATQLIKDAEILAVVDETESFADICRKPIVRKLEQLIESGIHQAQREPEFRDVVKTISMHVPTMAEGLAQIFAISAHVAEELKVPMTIPPADEGDDSFDVVEECLEAYYDCRMQSFLERWIETDLVALAKQADIDDHLYRPNI